MSYDDDDDDEEDGIQLLLSHFQLGWWSILIWSGFTANLTN